MKYLTLFIIVLAGCHTPRSIAARPTSALHLRVLGETNPDSAPPSCRVHGGSPPVVSGPPVWTRSTHRDRVLDSLSAGRISIHVV